MPIADPKLAAAKKRQILAGDVPSPTNPPPACRFHTRCWKAQDLCRQDEPPLEAKDGGNIAACHFPLTDAEVLERVPTSAARLSAVDRFQSRAARPRRGGRAARAARLRADRARGRRGGRDGGRRDREVAGVPLRRRGGARARVAAPTAPTRRGWRRSSARRSARADADFARAATGFSIGGVPPLGHPAPLRTLVDEDLLGYEVVWAAAGTPHAVFPIAPAELARARRRPRGQARRARSLSRSSERSQRAPTSAIHAIASSSGSGVSR